MVVANGTWSVGFRMLFPTLWVSTYSNLAELMKTDLGIMRIVANEQRTHVNGRSMDIAFPTVAQDRFVTSLCIEAFKHKPKHMMFTKMQGVNAFFKAIEVNIDPYLPYLLRGEEVNVNGILIKVI